MAIKPRDNESFYREVDEELRRDQVRSYWERYGKLAIAGVLLLLALIAGALWWNNQRHVKAGEKGAQLISAFDEISAGNKGAAAPKLDALEKSGSPGYRAAAILTRADLAVEENQLDRAAALFKQVADDKDLEETYRNLALVRQTHVQFDKLPPQAVIDRLKPLAVAGNPWFGSAGEMVGIAHLKLNRPQEAARIFAAMSKDKQVPESVRSRAGQMAGSLGLDVIEEPAAAAQEGN